VSFRKHFSY